MADRSTTCKTNSHDPGGFPVKRFYPIGTPGQPWGDSEKQSWLEAQSIERSYHDEVLARLDALGAGFEVDEYGALPVNAARYRLRVVTATASSNGAPWALITGGVHGYETSGVQGAISFLETAADEYRDRFNLVVVPCVSPWGYEVVNRWNPDAVDPNRSFVPDSPSYEALALMALVDQLGVDFLVHMDLHETTNTDETEFRPAAAARDGDAYDPGTIPDGFYTVGDAENPQPDFQAAIIAGVEAVTHIAPPDNDGQIIGVDITQPGVINYPYARSGLCAGITNARYTTTTEVYPDSPTATPERCIEAQIAAVRAGLDYALAEWS